MPWHDFEIVPDPSNFNRLSNQAQFASNQLPTCHGMSFAQVWFSMPENMPGIISESFLNLRAAVPDVGRLKAEWHLLQTPACPGLLMLFPCNARVGQCTQWRFLVLALFFSCRLLVQLNLGRDKNFNSLQQKAENHQSQINGPCTWIFECQKLVVGGKNLFSQDDNGVNIPKDGTKLQGVFGKVLMYQLVFIF